jgi:pyridinium-3,5-biscarboxylic acid mononucleotide synthase
MDRQALLSLLGAVAAGGTPIAEAAARLSGLPSAAAGDVTIDTGRSARCGFPEVIYCEGKSPEQLRDASRAILDHSDVLLATRADQTAYEAIARVAADARYHERARVVVVDRRAERAAVGRIVVVTGGAADAPVAEEAAITAEVMGNDVVRSSDVGVAGVHRLLAQATDFAGARVIIAVAGMEGALPGVVAGLVDCPVIGVPTSVGYGAAFGGIAPLLTMLNSCAAGVAVVNIDNGFGAARIASMINQASGGGAAEAGTSP